MNLWRAVSLLSSSTDVSHTNNVLSTRSSPLDIDPLPSTQYKGLIAISVLAMLSVLATFGLLCFITYRLVFWRQGAKRYLGHNQYIILIYNLLLADLQQSLGFLICLHWIHNDAIRAGTAACFLQGLWLQVGDPGSGLFVLAIAIHTFMLVTSGRKLEHKWFVVAVVGVWVFLAVIVAIPIANHGVDVMVPSGAWCWINEKYEAERLWTHYLWIFLAEFGTVILYAIMYFQLRRQISASSILGGSAQLESLKRLRRVVGYMVIYPVTYVVLSLPLAAGRMASARGQNPNLTYFCLAGAMMTSSGFVDVLVYTLTRRNLITDSEYRGNSAYNNIVSGQGGRNRSTNLTTTITTVTRGGAGAGRQNAGNAGQRAKETRSSLSERSGSTDNIVQKDIELGEIGKVYQETTIEITSEPAYPQNTSPRSSDEMHHHTTSVKGPIWGK
ncbi:G protein-coupled glucose receptor regulating Gpa2-domain-containing protein [Talaromyces proteolyticus]|uniref:G protein-coupled glucose receptor regulating Gpa2-domain-containing protein n=1 Tax=Talaromyces proteolyticus TaxID=1131652 RepID=A0AAD4L097_9EURO|nr:G protein-coupled glucose receptor regulating Gpa2-domain-containing protein [Talaromyces proteolyticus]KAH8703366.1 G protein-coupled glucose receptor regulating Gpa2-domain-containing protein [Talaromyces proteolyticus]